MKLSTKLNRRNFISRTAATGLGLSIVPSLGLGGCGRTGPEAKIPLGQNPDTWGLVTLYDIDAGWPNIPADIKVSGGMPGVDIDKNDNVWIITRSMPIIQAYDTNGKFLTSFGSQGPTVTSVSNGPVDLTFSMPNPGVHQLKLDHEGNVWIATWRLGVIYKCSPEGKVLMVLGTYNESGTDETHFGYPQDMVITPAGEIFVADGQAGTGRIVHFDPQGKFIKAWGQAGKGPGEFNCPHAIGLDSKGLVYVAERGNTRIQIFDQEGNFIDQWPNIIVPFDIWIDSEDNLWACGYGPLRTIKSDSPVLPRTEDNMIVKFNPEGRVLMNWTFTFGDAPGEFVEVHGLAVDSKGNVYASEAGHNTRTQKFIPVS